MKKFDKASTREFKLGVRDTSSVDMLNGNLWKTIMVFAVPIMISTFLQLLFSAADLVVVGRYCGEDSLAAVGATNAVSQLLVNLFTGLSVGVSVRVSRGFGQNSWIKVSKATHSAIPLAIVGGLVIAVIGLIFTRPILVAMETPAEILDRSVIYLKIYFCGMPFNLVYNYGAAVLRADGETKKPLYYLTIAGVLNVILNLFFVIVCKMDVAGVALATALTNGLAGFLVVIELTRLNDAAKLQFKYMKMDKKAVKEICRHGIPAGIQQSMFSIANVIIQSFLNSFGKATVAGASAAVSILGFGICILIAFSQACMNFAGQNYGAKQYLRMYKIRNICLVYGVGFSIILNILLLVFGEPLLGIYDVHTEEALQAGFLRLAITGLPTFINLMFDIVCSMLRAMKYSLLPTIISIAGICVVRLVILYTVFQIPEYHTLEVLFGTYPVSWAAALVAAWIAFTIVAKKKLPKVDMPIENR